MPRTPKHVFEKAVADIMAGSFIRDAAKKNGISHSALTRYMKRNGITLSKEELAQRKRAGGYKSVRPTTGCRKGCTCSKHKFKDNWPPTGRKNCVRCGSWRPLQDFEAALRNLEGTAIRWLSWCKSCQRARQREREGLARRGKPYTPRPHRKPREEVLARRREQYRERRKDPEYVERMREYDRFYLERKAREQGRTYKPRSRKSRDRTAYGAFLPMDPMKAWVEAKLANGYNGNIADLAVACAVSERMIKKILWKESDTIPETSVDKMLTNEGSTAMWEVFPELSEA